MIMIKLDEKVVKFYYKTFIIINLNNLLQKWIKKLLKQNIITVINN